MEARPRGIACLADLEEVRRVKHLVIFGSMTSNGLVALMARRLRGRPGVTLDALSTRPTSAALMGWASQHPESSVA
jgi:hypothetical protein